MSLGVGNFCGLDHELGDVGEESVLAEIDFFERDRREELSENAVTGDLEYQGGLFRLRE